MERTFLDVKFVFHTEEWRLTSIFTTRTTGNICSTKNYTDFLSQWTYGAVCIVTRNLILYKHEVLVQRTNESQKDHIRASIETKRIVGTNTTIYRLIKKYDHNSYSYSTDYYEPSVQPRAKEIVNIVASTEAPQFIVPFLCCLPDSRLISISIYELNGFAVRLISD